MKITILGCGSSGGVPLIGNNWGKCNPQNARNRRSRVSVLIENEETTLLIDTSPDMRQQALNCQLKKLSAVLYTHTHADHCHGIDELRSVNWMTKKPIDVFANQETMDELDKRFPYIFHRSNPDFFHKPSIVPHIINGNFTVGSINVTPIEQDHGYAKTLGFRCGDFAYSTDVKNLSDEAFVLLKGVKIWVVDCIRMEPHPTHSHFEQTLAWIKRLHPEQAFFTHMNESMDYEAVSALCPKGVAPAYDGLEITC